MTGPSQIVFGANDPLLIEDGSGVNNLPDDGNKQMQMRRTRTRRKARLPLGQPYRLGDDRRQYQQVGLILLGRHDPNRLQQVARLPTAKTMIMFRAGAIIDPSGGSDRWHTTTSSEVVWRKAIRSGAPHLSRTMADNFC